jgi:hypothetical protein
VSRARAFFAFPDPVNETAVRVTAAGVATMAVTALVTQQAWVLGVIAYGFIARVIAGPRLSPLALLSTRVITPRITGPHRFVAGPPKRFAQGLGAVATSASVIAYYVADWEAVAWTIAGIIVVLATLEFALRICIGCLIYARLVRAGAIRGSDCPECADVRLAVGSRVS